MNQDGYANQSSRIALSNDSVFNETAYTILFILCPEQDFLLDLKPWKLEGGGGGGSGAFAVHSLHLWYKQFYRMLGYVKKKINKGNEKWSLVLNMVVKRMVLV